MLQLIFLSLRLPIMKQFLSYFLIIVIAIYLIVNSCKREDKPLPVAIFNYSYTNECSPPPSEVVFENMSFEASVYRWDFGDGTTPVFEKNPSHVFSEEGIYNVELTAYGNGGMHTEIKTIYIVTKPIIDFSVSDTLILVNDSVTFTGIASSGVLPSAWFWTFGDGTTSTIQNCSHKYSSPGIYDITLTAVNACGNSYLEKKKLIKVNANGSPPIVNFNANNITINVGQTINFTDLTVNSPDTWNWNFAGGFPGNSNAQNPLNIQYNTPGYYDVTLTASNSFGTNSLTKTGYIHVLNAAPTAVFIKKITVKQMHFPVVPPLFVNLFYKVSDAGPPNTIYLNGVNQVISGLIQAELPVFWNISPYYQIPVLNHNYQISLWDKKTMPPQELFVGSVQFNPSTYTMYPSIVTLSQNGINLDVELQWQ